MLSTSTPVSCANVSIRADLAIEMEEAFLIVASSDDNAVNITIPRVTVAIFDATIG